MAEEMAAQMAASLTQHAITVLLVDDQAICGAQMRQILAPEKDIVYHFCQDPTKAIEMANAIQPTVILQDLVMPEIDGLTLVKFFRGNPATRDTPMIVLSGKEEAETKAEAFALGANDYIVKFPDKLELLARIRYHSRGYIAQLERNEAFRKLQESEKMLADEVNQAAKYVMSLLPEPLKGDVRINWRFVPSTQLGGDSFGYHWIDPDHLAMYLLDVSGHGVGASLMSVSAMNVLNTAAIPNTDFRDPGKVLRGLNLSFQMEKHDNKFFTIWYGVYKKKERKIVWAGAGHPAAILLSGKDKADAKPSQLESEGPIIGAWPDYEFENGVCEVGPFARLYVYSDGVYEVSKPDGVMWEFDAFLNYLATVSREDDKPMDQLIAYVRDYTASDVLADDFSIVQIDFGP